MENLSIIYAPQVFNNDIESTSLIENYESEVSCDKTMNELKKIYWHERQLLIVIPMLLRSATTFELVESLTVLVKYTREHVKLMEEQFPGIDKIRPNKQISISV